MYTSLESPENNYIPKVEGDGNVSMSEVAKAINARIKAHEKFIERDQEVIKGNLGFPEIVTDAVNRINTRLAKIQELRELAEFSLEVTTV